jgi:hypothetical protein
MIGHDIRISCSPPVIAASLPELSDSCARRLGSRRPTPSVRAVPWALDRAQANGVKKPPGWRQAALLGVFGPAILAFDEANQRPGLLLMPTGGRMSR